MNGWTKDGLMVSMLFYKGGQLQTCGKFVHEIQLSALFSSNHCYRNTIIVPTVSEKILEKHIVLRSWKSQRNLEILAKVRENSGNFIFSQGH